jgi:hypothetical protein
VNSTYQQVASSSEEAMKGGKRTERETEGLSDSNLKQGAAAGLKGACFNIATAVFLQMRYYYHLFLFLF